jgi:hypothetical protein
LAAAAFFLAPFLFEVAFCAMSLSLYHRLQSATHTATSLSAELAQANAAADLTAVALVPAPYRPSSNALAGCLRYGLAAQKLHRDTDATPNCASCSHPMQMEYRFTCDYVFQICSRLHHHQYPNTNFTDFEAGVAVFFLHDLTKRLSQSVKSRSMLNEGCEKQHKPKAVGDRRWLIAFSRLV